MPGGGYAGREQAELARLTSVFPERLACALDAQQLSKVRLAQLVGVTPSTVSAWANGKRLPRLPQLTLLAQALRVTTMYLLDAEAAVPADLGPTKVETEILEYIATENGRPYTPSVSDVADVFEEADVQKAITRLLGFHLLEPGHLRVTSAGLERVRS